jgi:hypothetical protein
VAIEKLQEHYDPDAIVASVSETIQSVAAAKDWIASSLALLAMTELMAPPMMELVAPHLVIPGRAKHEPGIHNHSRM